MANNTQPVINDLNLIIDEEFRSKYPPLSPEEFASLEKEILATGRIRDPLVVWNGILIDGHNRYQILQKNPQISFSVCEETFTDRYEVIIWICKKQLSHRNLTPTRWTYLLGKRYEAEKKAHGGDRKSAEQKSSSQSGNLISEVKTCDRIAAENNVSKNTVLRAEVFAKGIDSAEDIQAGFREKVLSGSIRVSRRELSAIAFSSPEKTAELIELIIHRPDNSNEAEEQLETRPIIESIEATLPENEQLDNMLREMEDAVDTIIDRWERCLSVYHELMQQDNVKKEVRIQIIRLKKYVREIEEEMKHGKKL